MKDLPLSDHPFPLAELQKSLGLDGRIIVRFHMYIECELVPFPLTKDEAKGLPLEKKIFTIEQDL